MSAGLWKMQQTTASNLTYFAGTVQNHSIVKQTPEYAL